MRLPRLFQICRHWHDSCIRVSVGVKKRTFNLQRRTPNIQLGNLSFRNPKSEARNEKGD